MSGTNLPATTMPNAAAIEKVLIAGDLSVLNAEQRVSYYNAVCESVGLNKLTRPFEYITLNGKLVLYAKRDCTDQLRQIHTVSVVITSREKQGDVFIVTARATLPSGRTDESIGAVSIGRLSGDALANAYMKAETKSKRRVTLSICGLGLLDETEVETVPQAKSPAEGFTGAPAKESAPSKPAVRDADLLLPPEEVRRRAADGLANATPPTENSDDAWKGRRAVDLGFKDRDAHVAAVMAYQDDAKGFSITAEWTAPRLAKRGVKTLWGLKPAALAELHEELRVAGYAGERFKTKTPPPADEPPQFADLPDDGVPF